MPLYHVKCRAAIWVFLLDSSLLPFLHSCLPLVLQELSFVYLVLFSFCDVFLNGRALGQAVDVVAYL